MKQSRPHSFRRQISTPVLRPQISEINCPGIPGEISIYRCQFLLPEALERPGAHAKATRARKLTQAVQTAHQCTTVAERRSTVLFADHLNARLTIVAHRHNVECARWHRKKSASLGLIAKFDCARSTSLWTPERLLVFHISGPFTSSRLLALPRSPNPSSIVKVYRAQKFPAFAP